MTSGFARAYPKAKIHATSSQYQGTYSWFLLR